MKTFQEFLTEEITSEKVEEAKKLASDIQNAALKHFPNSFVDFEYSRTFSKDNIIGEFGLISDKSDLPNGIRHNDPVHHKFMIYINKDGSYEASALMGAIMTKPEAGSHLAMKSLKTPFRKTKGDAKKMLSTFDTFFSRLKTLVKDNKDNIYKSESIKDKYFK